MSIVNNNNGNNYNYEDEDDNDNDTTNYFPFLVLDVLYLSRLTVGTMS